MAREFRNNRAVSKKALLAALIVCAGCASAPSLEGSWLVSDAKNMPPGSTVKMTFAKPDSMKMHIEMDQDMGPAGKVKIKADAAGTYKYDGKILTTQVDSVKFDLSAVPETYRKMMEPMSGQMETRAKDEFNKQKQSNLTFENPDKVTSKNTDGSVTTLTRVKA